MGSEANNTELTFDLYTRLELDIGTNGDSDSLMLFGDLSLGGGDQNELLLNSLAGAFEDNSTYVLVTYTGTLFGTFDVVTGLDSNYVLDYGSGTNDAITIYSTIPEPTSATLLPIGFAALALRRRQR